jgi:glucose-1-phosphate cytidylyltransferase
MKVVILAGGLGTRLSEETSDKPKPMVEIGGKPILWHIMKIFSSYGFNDFIICCGYKGIFIKEYFQNYNLRNADVEFNLSSSSTTIKRAAAENWKVTCVDTGDSTLTGGRLKRVKDYLDVDEPFLFTYGDGVGDINIKELISFHKKNNKLATVTAVSPPGRFGVLSFEGESVKQFNEKPENGATWINGGFFVLEPKVLEYIEGDMVSWEEEPIKNITKDGELIAYKHPGFWQPMDTLAEKKLLNELYDNNKAPWKSWE